jgi:protocatechuate 3,4-dioxygenase beta subunit
MRRRTFLRGAVLSGVGALTTPSYGAELPRTPADYEGPYYPVGPRHENNVLVQSDAGRGKFAGHYLRFAGEVVRTDGRPVGDARVDIWHTDPEGRYRHPRDRSKGQRHADFGYYGLTPVDERGAFEFFTLVPGGYGIRPAHIHYKIWQADEELLTSQIYFRQRGGTQGKSRSRSGQVQVVDLVEAMDTDFEIFYRIVV